MPLQSVQVYNILRSKDFSDEEAQLMAEVCESKANLTAKFLENLATKDDIAKITKDISEIKAMLRGVCGKSTCCS